MDAIESNEQFLDGLGEAIRLTEGLKGQASPQALEEIAIQLADVAARVRAGETLDEEYRQIVSFDVIAIRELDDVDDTHADYLELLSQLAADIAPHNGSAP